MNKVGVAYTASIGLATVALIGSLTACGSSSSMGHEEFCYTKLHGSTYEVEHRAKQSARHYCTIDGYRLDISHANLP
ncbi:hypothetical protein GS415_03940 [Rhodococcus hoagii]|nr:hypothetical protein [Prescottella equi]